MQLIFIPGFDEGPPYIFLNNWVLLGNNPRPELNALQYATELIGRFSINQVDESILICQGKLIFTPH